MPELPEVETYVRDLEPLLAQHQVTAAQIYWPRTIAAPDADQFLQQIVGQRFVRFNRRGKYILLGLESGAHLIVHLRMTGHLLVLPPEVEPDQHTHMVLDLDDGRRVHYQDPRKFGRIWLTSDPAPVLANLGPEPLREEFTVETLAHKLAGRKASIKAILLDQRMVAGVGNIYADEALFRAGIHPARCAGDLQPAEIERLHSAIQAVLMAAIQRNGSTLGRSNVQNYLRPNGEPGGFQDEHAVYKRAGKPCLRCGEPIERMVLAQRGSHFCPQCQTLSAAVSSRVKTRC
jgi:formamidopyrimidine-DNA glycosylase